MNRAAVSPFDRVRAATATTGAPALISTRPSACATEPDPTIATASDSSTVVTLSPGRTGVKALDRRAEARHTKRRYEISPLRAAFDRASRGAPRGRLFGIEPA